MKARFRHYRLLGAVLLALAGGVPGAALLFTDVGPGETPGARALFTALYFVLAGGVAGFRGGSRGWTLAVLLAWIPMALGAAGLAVTLTEPSSGAPRLALLLVLGPLLCSVTGAAVARRLRMGLRGRGTGREGDGASP